MNVVKQNKNKKIIIISEIKPCTKKVYNKVAMATACVTPMKPC